MKKLLALMLSVMMAVSLALPAFAADAPVDGDPGFFLENGIPAPIYKLGDAIPINAILNESESLGVIGGADGPTAIITSGPGSWANTDPEFDQMYQAMIDLHKEALGGVPGQIGVMVKGEYIRFPDAAPEVTNGRTMVPVRALVEALGGEVSIYGSDVRCKLDGMTVIFTIGSKEVAVELEAGEDEGCEQVAGVLEMDCAPYIKGGRTYVPVRFIGEALGYVVRWEKAYETAVLMDPEAMIAEIDKDFTILDRVLANAAGSVEEGKNYRYDLKGDVTVTAFDTLNGNTAYQGSVSSKLLMNSEAVSGTYSLTLSESVLDKLMESLMGADWDDEEYAEEAAMLRKVLGGLKDMEVIMTREGLGWVHAPILDELAGEKDIWCGQAVDEDLLAAAFGGTEAVTVGRLVAQSTYSSSFVTVWSDAMNTAAQLAAVMGDKCFTTSGGTSTLAVDLDRLDPDGELGLKDELKECALTLKVDSRGGATLSCTVQTAEGMDPGMRLTVDASLSGTGVSLTVKAHVANVGELKLSLTSQRQTTSEAPVSEPPEGANIVDAPELLEGLDW